MKQRKQHPELGWLWTLPIVGSSSGGDGRCPYPRRQGVARWPARQGRAAGAARRAPPSFARSRSCPWANDFNAGVQRPWATGDAAGGSVALDLE